MVEKDGAFQLAGNDRPGWNHAAVPLQLGRGGAPAMYRERPTPKPVLIVVMFDLPAKLLNPLAYRIDRLDPAKEDYQRKTAATGALSGICSWGIA
jgi:hypothetical protein